MPLLMEIFNSEVGMTFEDDDEGLFLSDAEGYWNDSTGIMRISPEQFAGYRQWTPDILDMNPIAFRLSNIHGGQIKLDGSGNIKISAKRFLDDAYWGFPDVSYDCRLSFTSTLEDDRTVLLTGTLYRNQIDLPESFGFDLYQQEYNVDLLAEATDYNGDTVPLPMAFGAVSYVKPVRLPDAGGGNQRYSAGSLTGTKHTHWHVFDDGVDVCTNATAISGNVFELTVAAVGEITISGTGATSDDYQIYAQLCGASYLNLAVIDDVGANTISVWQDSQIRVVDFLDAMAGATRCFFYILNGTMYTHAMDMTSDYYGTLAYNVRTDGLEGTKYEKKNPISVARYKWKYRESVASPAQMVKETELEESVTTNYAYGSDTTLDVMTTSRTTASLRLVNAALYYSTSRAFFSLPLINTLIRPGTKITLTDDRYTGVTLTANPLYVRDIVYDFLQKQMNIEGDASLTSS